MNLGALVDFTRTFLRADGIEPPPAQHIRDLLNQAQDEMSAELKTPSKVLTVTNQTTPFSLPSDARGTNPLIYVQWKDSDDHVHDLPIVSLANANLRFPSWKADAEEDDPAVAIFTEGVDSHSDLHIHPDPGAADYFIHYVVKPDDMSSMSDEPLNGEFAVFHVALAHYAAFMVSGNEKRFAAYRNYVRRASGNRRHGPKFRRNLMYQMGGEYYG